jgi:RimJ/RimL family protein N-acetyltransferase
LSAAFNGQPTLEGDTIRLRPTAAEDWDALYAVARDPQIWAKHPAWDRYQEPVFRAYFEDALASRGALTVIDKASGRVIGGSRFVAFPELDEVEIGWTFLSRDFWGGAVNRQMKRLMLGHALASFPRAVFRVGETNVISRRAMEKIGGRMTDRVEDIVRGGKPIRHVIYEIDRENFANGPLTAAA